MTIISRSAAFALPFLALAACAEPELSDAPSAEASPQDAFFEALSTHCGKAYAGELVSTDPVDADFADADMVMYVSSCEDDRIEVPFHVAVDGEWDRSRTWVITRTEAGLRLKHDHRHEDGEPDAVTMYGGDTDSDGTARVQEFPIDAESIALFEREGLTASLTNVWSVEVDPAGTDGARYVYQLKRRVEGGAPEPRLFRVEFDLTQEVEAPPPAWGWE